MRRKAFLMVRGQRTEVPLPLLADVSIVGVVPIGKVVPEIDIDGHLRTPFDNRRLSTPDGPIRSRPTRK